MYDGFNIIECLSADRFDCAISKEEFMIDFTLYWVNIINCSKYEATYNYLTRKKKFIMEPEENSTSRLFTEDVQNVIKKIGQLPATQTSLLLAYELYVN